MKLKVKEEERETNNNKMKLDCDRVEEQIKRLVPQIIPLL